MLGISRVDRVRNEKMLEAVGQITLSTYVKKRQLGWLGHSYCKRMTTARSTSTHCMLQRTAGDKWVAVAFSTGNTLSSSQDGNHGRDIRRSAGPGRMEGIGGRLHLRGGRLASK